MGIGRAVGGAFAWARDAIARRLVAMGVKPDHLTVAGFIFTLVAGVFLAMGAADRFGPGGLWGHWLASRDPESVGISPWNLWAGLFLFLCAAMDMLDGAVARIGRQATKFGGFLDSTLDRFSDFAIYAGIAVSYAWRGNVTYTLLAMLCICHAFAISYTRARAEDLIDRCRVGFWQRGERTAAVLIAVLSFNIPALLWQQGVSPAFTVWRRIRYTWCVTRGKPAPEDPREGPWWQRIQPWQYPRMSLPYDITVLCNIAFLIVAPISPVDLLRLV